MPFSLHQTYGDPAQWPKQPGMIASKACSYHGMTTSTFTHRIQVVALSAAPSLGKIPIYNTSALANQRLPYVSRKTFPKET